MEREEEDYRTNQTPHVNQQPVNDHQNYSSPSTFNYNPQNGQFNQPSNYGAPNSFGANWQNPSQQQFNQQFHQQSVFNPFTNPPQPTMSSASIQTQLVNPFANSQFGTNNTPCRSGQQDEEFIPPDQDHESSESSVSVEPENIEDDYDPLSNLDEYMRVRDQL